MSGGREAMGEGPEAEFLRQYREAVAQAMALHAGASLGPSLVDLPLEAGFQAVFMISTSFSVHFARFS